MGNICKNSRIIPVGINETEKKNKRTVYGRFEGGIAGKLLAGILEGFRQKFFKKHREEMN